MGGLGSGGHNRRHAGFVEQCRRIDAFRLQREGALRDRWSGRWTWTSSEGETNFIHMVGGTDAVWLKYSFRRNGGSWEPIDERVEIVWSPRHFGGAQAYFSCPRCSSRVRYLYGAGPRFLCRACHGLAHASSTESQSDRSFRKVRKLRASIGAGQGIEDFIPDRPRYMRRVRYEKIVQCIAEGEREIMDEMIVMMRRLGIAPTQKGFWS